MDILLNLKGFNEFLNGMMRVLITQLFSVNFTKEMTGNLDWKLNFYVSQLDLKEEIYRAVYWGSRFNFCPFCHHFTA